MCSANVPIPAVAGGRRLSTVSAAVPAVVAVGLCKSIDERPILSDVSVQISRGEYVAILGANGAGKSTLMKVLATLTALTSGQLRILGHDHGRDTSALRRRLGLIAHQSMLYHELSPRENLLFFARLYGVDKAEARTTDLLETVKLADRADEPVKTFSRGMVQRVAIARALMHDPELLLADEPFAGLDVASSRMLEEVLAGLHGEGKTILLVNHDVGRSLALAGRALVLRGGRLVLDRPTAGTAAPAILEAMGS